MLAVDVRQLTKTYVVPEREAGLGAAVHSVFRRRTRAVEAVAADLLRPAAGRVRRLRGSQRSRQDHHAEDALRAAASHGRPGTGARPRAGPARARLPEPHHAGDGAAQPVALGHPRDRLLRAQPGRLPGAGRRIPPDPGRAHRPARPGAAAGAAGAQSVPGRTDEVRDRGGAPAPAAGAVPGRAHHRPGRDNAAPHPRLPCRVQPRAPHHRAVDQPLHGGRRGALQPHRHDRPRPHPVRRRAAGSGPPLLPAQDHRGGAGPRRRATCRVTARWSPPRAAATRCWCPRPTRRRSRRGCWETCRSAT